MVIAKLSKSNQRNVIYDSNDISPTLQAAMGTGGGNVPMILEDVYIDVYNKRIKESPVCGTLSTHPQDGHSGTFWLMENNEELRNNTHTTWMVEE